MQEEEEEESHDEETAKSDQANREEDGDTRSPMERMKDAVEGLKCRRDSVLVASPNKPAPAPMSVEEEKVGRQLSFHSSRQDEQK